MRKGQFITAEDERFSEKYRNIGLEKSEIKYVWMIESMDNALGTVLNKLKEENILDNTIIIFYNY